MKRYIIDEEGVYELIQGMTNWQNHQWLRSGGARDLETVQYYAAMTRV